MKFLNFKDKQKTLDAYVKNKLWKDRIYINEDFSERTLAVRKKCFKEMKELKEKGIKAKVIYNKVVMVKQNQLNGE